MPEKAVLTQSHLIHYALKDTKHLIRFARNDSIQRSPHPWHRLSLKFGIFICDRNWNTCQKNRARTDLLNKTKIWQVCCCSSLHICHTEAMATLAEYGTRCLYEDTITFTLSWSFGLHRE